ncbi:MAG TPA: hypothetical protein VMF08_13450 [Candidatus Sulfotelmatobacter sp.]|nr:hypothetical protein [Candidatus Sulfotelmatobacter sp.]
MTKTAGRPKGCNNKVLMAFRFRRDMAEAIRKIAIQNDLPQARILEILVTRFGKEIWP